MINMKTTLVFTTYNWPEALELVLLSILKQSRLPDEVVIADDGSTEETTKLIEHYQKDFPIPIVHVWHEDLGYRKTIALNKAISQSKGDYIIQIDGDCILHKNFIEDHLKAAEKNCYLYGSRVNIQPEILETIFKDKIIQFSFFAKGLKRRTRNLRIPLFARLYGKNDTLSSKLRGCNWSFWKSDFLIANGFNEDMTSWGCEDSELVIRLINNGVKGKRLRYRAIVYHIWHKANDTKEKNINFSIQESTLKNQISRCDNGVDKYMVKNG